VYIYIYIRVYHRYTHKQAQCALTWGQEGAVQTSFSATASSDNSIEKLLLCATWVRCKCVCVCVCVRERERERERDRERESVCVCASI